MHRIVAAGTVVLGASLSQGAVQGLYLFDSISNPTPAVAPYEVLADSSGNGRDLTKQDAFGSVALITNRPAVMPSGTFALDSNAGGTGSIVTTNTPAFSVGNTGQLSIEFWYNRQVNNNGLRYIAEFGNEGANGWDIYESGGTVHAGFRTNTNAYSEMATGAIAYDTWNHIAVTFAADGTGRLYVNGSQAAMQSYTPANFSAVNSFLRLSAGFNATFSNIAFFDELRISDVALLPGTGTGVGELAWNASLAPIPEPTGLAAVALFSTGLIARRRRA
jgi:hypothetical protein